MTLTRLFYLGLGWFFVGLGIVGIIVPILPTAPFLLVSVWAFSRSSPELAEKLRNHPRAGPYIRHWQDHGVIPLFGKVMAVVMMTVMGVYLTVFSRAPGWAATLACITMALAAVYVVSRPSEPPKV